jgi:polyisoprenyl-teichoic acid--peptidoglycan teichoic acid transferase
VRRRRNANLLLALIVVGIALLVLSGIGIVLTRIAGPVVDRVRGRTGTALPPLVIDQIGRWSGASRVNVLLLGIDQRPNEDPATARTDTMMILTLDPASKTAGMLSIPRDLYVPLPDGGQERINAAHVFGGPDLAKRTVEYNFGIPIHHHVRVNFNVLITLIDLVGGVEVNNENDIDDPLYPDENYGYDPFRLKAGLHTLDGKTALKYARTRHGDSDFHRIRRQQQVIMALREKFLSSDAVTKVLPNAPAILQSLEASIDTDLSHVQMVQLLLAAKDVPRESIARVSIDETAVQPWTTPQGGSVVIPIRDRLRELKDQLYAPSLIPSPTPEIGVIEVLNGTQTRGLAARARSALEGQGFAVASIGDAPERVSKTVVYLRSSKRVFAERVARALGPSVIVLNAPDPNPRVDVQVALGDDYAPPAP